MMQHAPYLIPLHLNFSPLEICFLEETLDDLQALDEPEE